MIGMGFASFLTLLIISAILAAIVHGAGYRVLSGAEGYFAKLIVGWIGGWIGSPVLGYWGGAIRNGNVHLIPAILGSIAAIFMQVAVLRLFSTMRKPALTTETEPRRVA
jgi:uncharacterized membrane protein YeaQ/YmgE (transglycosylase-associated protein family)